MSKASLNLVNIIVKYNELLQRYARRLVKDQDIAAAIVKEAFEQVYDLNGFNIGDESLCQLFKDYTFKIASLWLLAQSKPNPQNNQVC